MVFVDDTTYVEIFFNVTSCDGDQYQCHVMTAPTNQTGQGQASLEVENCKFYYRAFSKLQKIKRRIKVFLERTTMTTKPRWRAASYYMAHFLLKTGR